MEAWQEKFNLEIDQAKVARASGNEGRARVGARRAAGIIIGEYLRKQNETTEGDSAYDRLRALNNHPNLSPEIHQVLEHLMKRVNQDFQLPDGVDLIQEVEWLRNELLIT